MVKPVTVDLTAVILRVKGNDPQVMTVKSSLALPSGAYDPDNHRTLEVGLRQWVESQTGQTLDYVEQLYTYGNWHRRGDVTVGYYALIPYVKSDKTLPGRWVDLYSFFPWEDFRTGAPEIVNTIIKPALLKWIDEGDSNSEISSRKERVALNFNDFENWDMSRVLFRYEILYEVGLVGEALRDWDDWAKDAKHRLPITTNQIENSSYRELAGSLGAKMAGDHRRILASTLARVRGKISYRPIVFKLLPKEFTLLKIQHHYEGLTGHLLHKQNFRRYLKQGKYVEETGDMDSSGPGRPAALYRFRKDVEAERVNLGLNLPFTRR